MDGKRNSRTAHKQSPTPKSATTGKFVDTKKYGGAVSKSKSGQAIDWVFDSEPELGLHAGNLLYTETIKQINSLQFYRPYFANAISLLSNSKKGLAASAAIDFINLSGFTQIEFQTTFKTTVKTIQSYAAKDLKLDSVLSEKLLKCFALFEKGISVFGSPQAFHDWLHLEAYGLGNQFPYELMDTITGITLIEEELIRLEYGDLA